MVAAAVVNTDSVGNLYILLGPGAPRVRRLDSSGAEAWTAGLGSTPPTKAAIGVDLSGNVCILGGLDVIHVGRLSLVGKFDSEGKALWSRTLPPATPAYSLAVDATGSIYVVGGVNGNPLPEQTSAGGSDVFVIKLKP